LQSRLLASAKHTAIVTMACPIGYGPAMAYRFASTDTSLAAALRRIATEQLAGALAALDDNDRPLPCRVHRVRIATKRLRALARLMRPGFDEAEAVNAALRDTARQFAPLREASVLRECFDDVVGGLKPKTRAAFADVRVTLAAEEAAVIATAERECRFDDVRERLAVLAAAAPSWTVAGDGFDVIEDGLTQTYRAARRMLAAAHAQPDADRIHEWRKRVKAHGFHMRLIAAVDPVGIAARERALDELGDLLGEHHDLDMLAAWLARLVPDDGLTPVADSIAARRGATETAAFAIGAVLFDEPAKTRVRRWRKAWRRWQEG
jgi:CHAD domain-containing protein